MNDLARKIDLFSAPFYYIAGLGFLFVGLLVVLVPDLVPPHVGVGVTIAALGFALIFAGRKLVEKE